MCVYPLPLGRRLGRWHTCSRFSGRYLEVDWPGHAVTTFDLWKTARLLAAAAAPLLSGPPCQALALRGFSILSPRLSPGHGKGCTELENAPEEWCGAPTSSQPPLNQICAPRLPPCPPPWLLLAPSTARPAHLEGMW